jgi:hypothetical protein
MHQHVGAERHIRPGHILPTLDRLVRLGARRSNSIEEPDHDAAECLQLLGRIIAQSLHLARGQDLFLGFPLGAAKCCADLGSEGCTVPHQLLQDVAVLHSELPGLAPGGRTQWTL